MSNSLTALALATVTPEEAHAEEVEIGQINTNPDNPRFLSEWDLPGDTDNPDEVAQINAFLAEQDEHIFNRAN
jgi:hypothetical protein